MYVGGGRGAGGVANYYYYLFFWGGGQREGYGGHIWPKTPKMALISENLAADSSPDASTDILGIEPHF